jgi:hypothetical protein
MFKKIVMAALITAALVPAAAHAEGWNFEGMKQACAVEAQAAICQQEVEHLKATQGQLMRMLEVRPEIAKDDQVRFTAYYRVKFNEEQRWFADIFPKAWAVRFNKR